MDQHHGRYRQILFLIGRFLKIFYSETAWPNEIDQLETRIACGSHICKWINTK
jgi:hypothetical protein